MNQAPVAYNDSYALLEDTIITVLAPGILGNDTDADGDSLSAILVQDILHGALVLYSNGSFSYTPTENYFGSDCFSYKVTDGMNESNTAIVNITVFTVNDPPTAYDDVYTVAEDSDGTIFAVLENDIDNESDSLTIASVTQPMHGSVANNGNDITYTSHTDYCGPDSFTYTISDGNGGIDTAMVTVMVTCVNDPPTAFDDTYNILEDSTLDVKVPGILGNDSDVDNDILTAVLISDVSFGTLNLNSNGSFTYIPNANFKGVDYYTYYANDSSSNSNIAIVNITVESVNDAPALTSIDDHMIDENTTLTVLLSASDPDDDVLSFLIFGLPSFASFVDNSDGTGSIGFMPGFNDAGFYPVIVNVSDGNLFVSDVFNLTVNNVNRPPNQPSNPSPSNGAININIDTDLSWTNNDPDEDSLTYDVYFGATIPPLKIIKNQSDTIYDPGTMNPGTTFYWQIAAWDNHGAKTEGPIWNFTTEFTSEIIIKKWVSDDNSSWSDSITVDVNDLIYWNITVENSGDIQLTDIKITDDNLIIYGPFSLDVNEVRSFYYTTVALTDFNNTATVNSKDPYGNIVSDSDWAEILIAAQGTIDLELEKKVTIEYDDNVEYEGLSHGYWKKHLDDWVNYVPSDKTGDVFNLPHQLSCLNKSLLKALKFGGGSGVVRAAMLLMKQSVAAILNAAHPGINYPLTESEVINTVNEALNTLNRKTMLSLKNTLDDYNNLGGDLNDNSGTGIYNITFTISLLNNGTNEASGVEVSDVLSANLTFISANANIGFYNPEIGIWNIGSLPAGVTAILEITTETNITGADSNIAEVIAANEIDVDSTPNNHDPSEDDQDSVTFAW